MAVRLRRAVSRLRVRHVDLHLVRVLRRVRHGVLGCRVPSSVLRGKAQEREKVVVHEHARDLAEERLVVLDVGDDVDLVEDDGRVEDVECRVVDRAREHDVLEELEAVCVVDLALDRVVTDGDWLVEAGGVAEEVAVVGLVVGEFGVICVRRLDSRRVCGLDPRTFEYTNDTEEDIVVQYMFIETMLVQ